MWLSESIYERLPQFFFLVGLLFVAGGLYLGFDFVLAFYYIGFGLLNSAYGVAIFLMRFKYRRGRRAAPAEAPDVAAPPERSEQD